MKRLILFFALCLLAGCCGETCCDDVVVELHSQCYDFTSEQSPLLSLSQQNEVLHLSNDVKQGFTIMLIADFQPIEDGKTITLLDVEGVARLIYRGHNPKEWTPQNYVAYPVDGGSVPVVEAELQLHPEDGQGGGRLVVGMPLAMLQQPFSKHEVVLHFTGVEWSIYVDGRLYDRDFAIGYPKFGADVGVSHDKSVVSDARIFAPALTPLEVEAHDVDANIQYWTPPFHNAWVGDVATIYHDGRYHVFYLFDRRGHASKLGRGGHYFEHLSTADFKTWTEHEPAVPIEHQWETMGTGTLFVYDGKLCLAYGLHTTRIYPREQTTLPMMWEAYEKSGRTQLVDYTSVKDFVPAGATYSVSGDGVADFTKSHMLIHPCENPSIFPLEDGSLRMLANYGSRGEWQSRSITDGWECINEHFPPGGDCTFYFEWGGYDYIIGGFNQLYCRRRGEGDDRWWSVTAEGRDMYNGMSVPAVSEITDSRMLMAGWVKTQNWGGVLVIHEMVQFPDGRLGSKWMEEIVPATEPSLTLSAEDEIALDDTSFMLTCDVEAEYAERGRVGVKFCDEQDSDESCEWQLQLDRERAQFAHGVREGFARDERTLREGGDVSAARNYAIAGGMRQDGATQVRMILHYDDKLGGSVIDVEIAGQRTMLSYRPNLKPHHIKFLCDGVRIKNLRKANLK